MASDKSSAQTGEEASQWFTRLNQTAIRTDDLLAFRQWRANPDNAAAYEEVERVWKRSGALSKDPAILSALDDARRRNDEAKARPRLVRLTLVAGLCGGAVVALLAAALIYVPPPLGGPPTPPTKAKNARSRFWTAHAYASTLRARSGSATQRAFAKSI